MESIIAMVIGSHANTVTTAAEWKRGDLLPSICADTNSTLTRPTAADTIEAIIAREIGVNSDGTSDGAGWKKVGSRTSVCSDNTSDTLSADEGQRDEDEVRPRRGRTEETSASSVVGTVLPAVIDHNRNGCGPHGLATSSANGPDMGVFSFLRQSGNTLHMPQTKEPLSSFNRHFNSSKPPDARHVLANGDNRAVPPAGSLMASVLGRGAHTLRVRDVIHTAIEENLQSRNSPSASLDNLWQLYSQNQGLLPRSVVTADMPNESAQDLSCRNREPHSAVVKAPPAPQNCVGPRVVAAGLLSTEKSPPPAHSHYGRPPVAVRPPPPPVVDRCQDPLYHLAEVAVQRGRVEVSGDRHRSSPVTGVGAGYNGPPHLRPSVHPGELNRSRDGVPAPLPGGSITLGTPRHLMAADMPSRPLVPVADVSQHSLPHAAKVKDSVELAQEALRYLGQPDSSQRAVMEQVMAQVARSFTSSNPSHTILMGDYVTAQQMQTSQYQQTTQPPNIPSHCYPHRQPTDHRTGVRDHVPSPRIPDLLDGMRMMTDATLNHVPAVQNRPHLPERPQHPIPSSQFSRRPLTAASVIDAIITHQINKEVPVSGTLSGTVLNRLPEPPVMSLNSARMGNVNGSIQPDRNISSMDGRTALYPLRPSIAERLEKEHGGAANGHRAVAIRNQETSKSAASSMPMVQLVTRAVTLGEHIDKIIQKDFSIPAYDSPQQMALDTFRNGMCITVVSFCLNNNRDHYSSPA